EPLVNAGSRSVNTLAVKWTVVTGVGKKGAHFAHTFASSETGFDILTKV
ncbi:type I methionyl aminopeptidase, partial [Bacillus velezensis]